MFMDCKVLDFEQRFDQILSEFEEYKEISESVEVMSDHKLYAFYMSKIKRLESLSMLTKRKALVNHKVIVNLILKLKLLK